MSAALYVHIPFCEKRCTYCDFYTVARRNPPLEEYVELVRLELRLWSERSSFATEEFQTIFFGGGTPSLLSPLQIDRLLDAAFSIFRFSDDVEITLEANPGTVTLESLRGYRSAGVNRLSLGVQSFLPQELAQIERIHSVRDIHEGVRWARQAGLENLSLDLIFALPGQRFEQWAGNLRQAIALEPEHLSTYNLTIEKGSPLARQVERGEPPLCDEAAQRRMYLHSIDFLERTGFSQYEVSNFARPGLACRHNLKYWDGSPYLGVGVSAHSFSGGRRFWNVANLRQYLRSLGEGSLATEDGELLSRSQAMFESVFLNLRQRPGLSLRAFEDRFGVPITQPYGDVLRRLFPEAWSDGLKPCARGKWFEIREGRLRLTREGLLLADALCVEFESGAESP